MDEAEESGEGVPEALGVVSVEIEEVSPGVVLVATRGVGFVSPEGGVEELETAGGVLET